MPIEGSKRRFIIRGCWMKRVKPSMDICEHVVVLFILTSDAQYSTVDQRLQEV